MLDVLRLVRSDLRMRNVDLGRREGYLTVGTFVLLAGADLAHTFLVELVQVLTEGDGFHGSVSYNYRKW